MKNYRKIMVKNCKKNVRKQKNTLRNNNNNNNNDNKWISRLLCLEKSDGTDPRLGMVVAS